MHKKANESTEKGGQITEGVCIKGKRKLDAAYNRFPKSSGEGRKKLRWVGERCAQPHQELKKILRLIRTRFRDLS